MWSWAGLQERHTLVRQWLVNGSVVVGFWSHSYLHVNNIFCHSIQNSLLIIFAKFQNDIDRICHARHSERLQGIQLSNSLAQRGSLTVSEVALQYCSGFRLNLQLLEYSCWQWIHLKQGLSPCITVIIYCPFFISSIICTRTQWPQHWNCSVLIWLSGKQYEFQTPSEGRGYTVGFDDAIICDCVKCRLRTCFHPYPYVYITPKCSLFANSITYIYILWYINAISCNGHMHTKVSITKPSNQHNNNNNRTKKVDEYVAES